MSEVKDPKDRERGDETERDREARVRRVERRHGDPRSGNKPPDETDGGE